MKFDIQRHSQRVNLTLAAVNKRWEIARDINDTIVKWLPVTQRQLLQK